MYKIHFLLELKRDFLTGAQAKEGVFFLVFSAFLFFSFETCFASPKGVQKQKIELISGFSTSVPYGVVLDSRTGKIFFEKEANTPMAPASMSKVMTMLMVLEALKAGHLSLDQELTISEQAWRHGGAPSGGSTMYAALHSKVKVSDLMRGIAVVSANDACIALAEAIDGSEEAFAQHMTIRAHELGLKYSNFTNATGLPNPEHKTTVYELAQMAHYLIEAFPETYKLYSVGEMTWSGITQKNRNPLLSTYPGADGMKTGYTKESGYGMIASAVREGRRLIAVVNGARSTKERAIETQRLLDYGFRYFKPYLFFRKGEIVGRARVWGGNAGWVKLRTAVPIKLLLSEEELAGIRGELTYDGPVIAPISENQKIGFIKLMLQERTLLKVPLYAQTAVAKEDKKISRALDSLWFMMFGG